MSATLRLYFCLDSRGVVWQSRLPAGPDPDGPLAAATCQPFRHSLVLWRRHTLVPDRSRPYHAISNSPSPDDGAVDAHRDQRQAIESLCKGRRGRGQTSGLKKKTTLPYKVSNITDDDTYKLAGCWKGRLSAGPACRSCPAPQEAAQVTPELQRLRHELGHQVPSQEPHVLFLLHCDMSPHFLINFLFLSLMYAMSMNVY